MTKIKMITQIKKYPIHIKYLLAHTSEELQKILEILKNNPLEEAVRLINEFSLCSMV